MNKRSKYEICLEIVAGEELTRRASALMTAINSFDFRGTLAQLRAFYLTRVLGRTQDEAAEELGIARPSVTERLAGFYKNCHGDVPEAYRSAPDAPKTYVVDPAILDALPA